MAVKITKLKGMNDTLASALTAQGISNSDQLLEAATTPKQRRELAGRVSVETRAILELANRADLSRIKGVAGAYSDLLEQAGVDTVKELATRRPDNLHKKIVETNEASKATNKVPTQDMVSDWVAQAKELPKTLRY